MRWTFVKYTGCGNDFILFDNRQGLFPLSNRKLIQKLCHRHWGIGADGIILFETSAHAHGRMRILNADGSEAEMCGNGIRCLVHWMEALGVSASPYLIETMRRTLKAWLVGSAVCIEMGPPTSIQWQIPLQWNSESFLAHYLDTGVPHVVFFVENIETFDLNQIGPFIRYHPTWQPQGTNLSIGQQISSTTFKIRTFERGVEGETLACGTGATAVALAAAYQCHLKSPLIMQTRSGTDLKIEFCLENQTFSSVTLTGPALCTFQGTIDLLNRME